MSKPRPSPPLRRLRLILPPDGSMLTWAFVFLLCEAPVLVMLGHFGAVPPGMPLPGKYLLMIVAVVLGAGRATRFHPHYQPEYLAWLARTPWTRGRPLPGGPVFLVPEDVLVMGGLALLALTQPDFSPWSMVARYLIAYLAAVGLALWGTEATGFGYLTAFGVGLAVRLWPDPVASLAAALLTLPVASLGLWRSLAEFPWEGGRRLPKVQMNSELGNPENPVGLGWPYDALSPKPTAAKVMTLADKLLVSLTAGWMLFSACGPCGPETRKVLAVLALMVTTLGLTLFRLLAYANGFQPPLSLWGRLRTFRLVIPGYDQIFLGPFISLVAIILSSYEFLRMGLDSDIWMPITVAIGLFVGYTSGPTLTRWRLTAKVRIVSSARAGNPEFVQTN